MSSHRLRSHGVEEDIFIKYHGSNLDRDWLRVCTHYDLIKDTRLFDTPRPIRREVNSQSIVYERFQPLIPLMSRHVEVDVFSRLGKSLASLHHSTSMRAEGVGVDCTALKEFLPAEADRARLCADLPQIFLHSDFWHGNVFVFKSDQFAILDPIPAPILEEASVRPTNAAIDVAMMHMSILCIFPLLNQIKPDIGFRRARASEFLNSYCDNMISIDSIGTKKLILEISRRLATLHVNSFKSRLPFPLARVKKIVDVQNISRLEAAGSW